MLLTVVTRRLTNVFFPDINGSISQKWKRLRKCCASLRGVSIHNQETSKSTLLETSPQHILVSTAHTTSSLRIPSSTKKSSVQDVLRAKLSQIHVGLRKRRALSVQEFFHNPTNSQEKPPTFYVPSPSSPLKEKDDIPPVRTQRSRQRTINSLTFSPSQTEKFIRTSGQWDNALYEPPPDYDVEERPPNRRWSVITSVSNSIGKPKNSDIEKLDIKIPKTKINRPFDRARSQSPNWKKDQVKSKKSETRGPVTSQSQYELAKQQSAIRKEQERQVC